MRPALLLPLLALPVACGEPVRDDHFANDVDLKRVATAPVDASAVPVRIGEMGPSFDACTAAGTTRHLAAGERLPVRSAPFDTAKESGAIAAESRFFICTRSHDQKWFGVVHDESGTLALRCGVSAPVTERRAYGGPCRSGWVSSAFVKLVSGVDQAPPPNQSGLPNVVEGNAVAGADG